MIDRTETVSARDVEATIGRLVLQLGVVTERLAVLQATYDQLVAQYADLVERHNSYINPREGPG